MLQSLFKKLIEIQEVLGAPLNLNPFCDTRHLIDQNNRRHEESQSTSLPPTDDHITTRTPRLPHNNPETWNRAPKPHQKILIHHTASRARSGALSSIYDDSHLTQLYDGAVPVGSDGSDAVTPSTPRSCDESLSRNGAINICTERAIQTLTDNVATPFPKVPVSVAKTSLSHPGASVTKDQGTGEKLPPFQHTQFVEDRPPQAPSSPSRFLTNPFLSTRRRRLSRRNDHDCSHADDTREDPSRTSQQSQHAGRGAALSTASTSVSFTHPDDPFDGIETPVYFDKPGCLPKKAIKGSLPSREGYVMEQSGGPESSQLALLVSTKPQDDSASGHSGTSSLLTAYSGVELPQAPALPNAARTVLVTPHCDRVQPVFRRAALSRTPTLSPKNVLTPGQCIGQRPLNARRATISLGHPGLTPAKASEDCPSLSASVPDVDEENPPVSGTVGALQRMPSIACPGFGSQAGEEEMRKALELRRMRTRLD